MRTVTIRELRNSGGKVVDRVLAGESLLVTRGGRPVAELRPVRRHDLSAEGLVERWRELPSVDPAGLQADLDSLLDTRL